MKVKELLKGLSYDCVQGSEEIEVTEIVNDSRKVVPGCLFMCITGANFDGHDYAAEVTAKGAKALVVSRPVKAAEDVTVIMVRDTRYAMAFLSAAWFGHPAREAEGHRHHGNQGEDDHSISGKVHSGKCRREMRSGGNHRDHHWGESSTCRQYHAGVLYIAEDLCGDGGGRTGGSGDGGLVPGAYAAQNPGLCV